MTSFFMVHPGPLPVRASGRAGFTIRPAVPADGPKLAALLAAAFDDSWTVEKLHSELLDDPNVACTWVAVRDEDGALLATSSELLRPASYGAAGCVHWVASDPHARGLSLGARVTEQTLVGFAERGLKSSVLATDSHRLAAIKTYLRLGFIPEPRNDDERQAWSEVFTKLLSSA